MQPALSATKSELLARYNRVASALKSMTAQVQMVPTAGSALSGVIEQYHEVNGFILASRPASIRVIGQAPIVAKDVFDMVSDGETFRIFIPSKNKFIVGPTALRRPANKPIENLRPQHLFDALLWPEVPRDAVVLLEQIEDPPRRFYVLTLATREARSSSHSFSPACHSEDEQRDFRARILAPCENRANWRGRGISAPPNRGPQRALLSSTMGWSGGVNLLPISAALNPASLGSQPGDWNLSRKIWFDRVDLQVARIQNYGPDGGLLSDVRYGDWQPAGDEAYPHDVSVSRPADEYQLEIRISQLTLNQPIPASRFQLAQPPGTELVQLGEEKQP